MDNFIQIYENVISKELCEYFIDFFENEDKLGNTFQGTMGPNTKKLHWKDAQDLNIRINKSKQKLYDSPEHLKMLHSYEEKVFQKFTNYLLKYHSVETHYTKDIKKRNPLFLNTEISGGPLMHRYKPPTQGYHIWHSDWGSGSSSGSTRMLVGMAYLNDVEEGGETEFLHQKVKIKPKQGTLVVWPAYFTHLHRGNKPISNSKYIINMWANPTA